MLDRDTDRPLVTFALFAYNQEQYIREAVEGAFGQTYTPLEIILSDDCSSDETFEIMQKMAQDYDGHHTIHVRRSLVNRGLAMHMNDVACAANGEIIVVAAGDDISHNERVAFIESVFRQNSNTQAVFSDFVDVSIPFRAFENSCLKIEEVSKFEVYWGGGGVGTGATYAYKKNLFHWPTPLPQSCLCEDRILPARAKTLGKLIKMPVQLVKYRRHDASTHCMLKKTKNLSRESSDHLAILFDFLRVAHREGKLSKMEKFVFRAIFLFARRLQLFTREEGVFLGKAKRVFGRFVLKQGVRAAGWVRVKRELNFPVV